MNSRPFSITAPAGSELGADDVSRLLAESFDPADYEGRRVLLIVPDGTRTAPVGLLFHTLHERIGAAAKRLDVMVALGTHPPMSEAAICDRLEITPEERAGIFRNVQLLNHEWNNPAALRQIGVIAAREISELSGGLFEMEVAVTINARLFEYDEIVIVGPVFPHEVVGFSGGNKYLFPGVAGPEVLNFFHWLGAVITNPMIIGNKWTPVRRVVDRAASLVELPKRCCAMVVAGGGLAGLFVGDPVSAWDEASELSRQRQVEYKDKPFQTVLSCAPKMYDEIWVAGKCMYKLEPVVADGGELIIYAPHITEVSLTHGRLLEEIGYHCRDYFLAQWDQFKDLPWGILAHSTHVRGIGRYENGVEKPRITVTLATRIPPEVCARINLGYRDPASVDVESYANREEEGVLLVRQAGEMLYQLRQPAEWARGA